MSNNNIVQRALILQGGGALGAYDAGAFKALYKKLIEKDGLTNRKGRPLFDIVAGTSSGAMNGSILVSHVIEKGTWKGSVEKLEDFWKYVSAEPDLRYWYPYQIDKNDWIAYWDNQKKINSNTASGEAARRYYSTKQFLCSGVPHVYLPEFSTPCIPFNGFPPVDNKFLDNFGVLINNTWYIYSNRPLRESLNNFAHFPIKSKYDLNSPQPRLLLIGVDVQEGAAVTFDSYPKDKGDRDDGEKRESEYGDFMLPKESPGDYDKGHYQYKISYPNGIELDYVMSSGSVPINYQYTTIDDVGKLKPFDNPDNIVYEKTTRYFWDGGLLSNTPLRELIQSHKDYWFEVEGKGKDDAPIPDLDVYIINVWPTKEEPIPIDYDGSKDRKEDILLNDKTDSDEKNANIVSDYISLVKKIIEVTKTNGEIKDAIDKILSDNIRSSHRSGKIRQYKDLINGRFEINVKRIERKRGVENDIYNKMLDYSTETIKQLMQDGYDDTTEIIERWKEQSSW